jgi:hypothetical protein
MSERAVSRRHLPPNHQHGRVLAAEQARIKAELGGLDQVARQCASGNLHLAWIHRYDSGTGHGQSHEAQSRWFEPKFMARALAWDVRKAGNRCCLSRFNAPTWRGLVRQIDERRRLRVMEGDNPGEPETETLEVCPAVIQADGSQSLK